MSFFRSVFGRKPVPAPISAPVTKPCTCPPPVSTNPLDLGNGYSIETRDEFNHLVAEYKIPNGGWISFTYAGREVFRIDQYGGKNMP